MNKRLLLLVTITIFIFSSCKKGIIGHKSGRKADINVEEIDFDYFQTRTKVRYAEGDKQVSGNAHIRIKKDSLIWFSVSPSVGLEATRFLEIPLHFQLLTDFETEFALRVEIRCLIMNCSL